MQSVGNSVPSASTTAGIGRPPPEHRLRCLQWLQPSFSELAPFQGTGLPSPEARFFTAGHLERGRHGSRGPAFSMLRAGGADA